MFMHMPLVPLCWPSGGFGNWRHPPDCFAESLDFSGVILLACIGAGTSKDDIVTIEPDRLGAQIAMGGVLEEAVDWCQLSIFAVIFRQILSANASLGVSCGSATVDHHSGNGRYFC